MNLSRKEKVFVEKKATKQNIRRDFFWNAAGSLVYALASIILSFVVIRLAGSEEGGIFGFGFSTLGQQMFIIAYFGIRPFHITDRGMEYRFQEYLLARNLTTGLAVLGTALFLGGMYILGRYSSHKAWILFFLCGYKIFDGYADVYESELQRIGYLYCTGQSLFFRTLASVSVLIVTLWMHGGLALASGLAVIMQGVGTYVFAVRVLRKQRKDAPVLKTADLQECPEHIGAQESDASLERMQCFRKSCRLLKNTALLFVSVFLDFYVFSASKYAVDNRMSSTVSGFYNILFMPASFIYLIANFMIRPTLTTLADQFKAGEHSAFRTTIRRMTVLVAGLSLLILLGGAVFGKPALWILEWMLGASAQGMLLKNYGTFLLLLAGGGFYALANVFYYVLVTIRGQKSIFVSYGISCIAAACLAGPCIGRMGLFGGALSYLCMMVLLLLLFVFFTMRRIDHLPCAQEDTVENR